MISHSGTTEPPPGERIENHGLAELVHKSDLVWYDGPHLSLFENRLGEPYLFLLVDRVRARDRWIVFPVDRERLALYEREEVTLRNLLLEVRDGNVFVTDDSVDGGPFEAVWLARVTDLPEDYLPGVES